MTLLFTVLIVGTAMLIMSIALIFTGENKVHSSCAATSQLDDADDHNCAFCPNDEEEDQITTLSKVGYPGRTDIVSKEVFAGKKDRNIVVERLKYNSGRD